MTIFFWECIINYIYIVKYFNLIIYLYCLIYENIKIAANLLNYIDKESQVIWFLLSNLKYRNTKKLTWKLTWKIMNDNKQYRKK